MLKKTPFIAIFIAIFSLFLGIMPVFAQEKVENAGFVPGNIWYSKDPFFAGDIVFIHTIVFNSSMDVFSGTVEFYDSDRLLGEVPFSVGANGGFKDISIEWKVVEGYHKIFALIKTPKMIRLGTSASITLGNEKSDESEKFVRSLEKPESATTTVKNFFDEKEKFAKEYAEKNLPAPIYKSVDTVSTTLEGARSTVKDWADQKGTELNEKILNIKKEESKYKALNKKEEKSALQITQKPLAYVYAFLVNAIAYIFGSKLFFYGGLMALLFFIIRFVKRTFFF
ncbi:MAG: hypothetical protein AAB488_02465 [Patescibacteria group bacterium]